MAGSVHRVVVVGAGIAGLTSAIALDRAGIEVQLFERATGLTQAGTALSLWPNALAALRHIGLDEATRQIGKPESAPEVRDRSGKLLLRIQQGRLSEDLALQALIVLRSDLQQLLLRAASEIPLHLKSPVKRIVPQDDWVEVQLVDGEWVRASVVLACDGVHSIGRELFSNPQLMYRNRTSWRALVPDAAHLVPTATLTVGSGNQIVAGSLRDGSAYWGADVPLGEGVNESITDRRRFLLDTFSEWHDPIPELIRRTTNEGLVLADLYDSIPRRLVADRVALLGDAGHPMTPDLGQGACQAIEDAVVVAECLRSVPDPVEGLHRYESLRLSRVRSVVRGSRRLGQLATSTSPLLIHVRDLIARHLPPSLNARITARVASEDAFARTLPGRGRATP